MKRCQRLSPNQIATLCRGLHWSRSLEELYIEYDPSPEKVRLIGVLVIATLRLSGVNKNGSISEDRADLMLLAVFRRNGNGVTIYDDSVGQSCCSAVLLAPEFKPKLSVLLKVVVGRTKILPAQLHWKMGRNGTQCIVDGGVRLALVLLVLSGDVELNPCTASSPPIPRYTSARTVGSPSGSN